MEVDALQSEVLELLSFLIASARGLIDEPASYGPLRLVEAAARLIALLQRVGVDSEFFPELEAKLRDHAPNLGNDEEALTRYLDDLMLGLTYRLKANG